MTWYQKLKDEQGEAIANARMKEIRAMRVNYGGGAFSDPNFARKAQALSVKSKKQKKDAQEIAPSQS